MLRKSCRNRWKSPGDSVLETVTSALYYRNGEKLKQRNLVFS